MILVTYKLQLAFGPSEVLLGGEFLQLGNIVYTITVLVALGPQGPGLVPIAQGLNRYPQDLRGGTDCNETAHV